VDDYKKANEMLDAFNKSNATDQRAKLYSENKDYLTIIKENSGRFAVEKLDINSGFSDYGTSFNGNNLVFASNRETGGISRKIQKWTNQPFTKLFTSIVDTEGKLGVPVAFSSSIDSKFNESTPVFTNDGKTMYFTRNNYNKGKKGRSSKDIILLKIYKATLRDGKWQDVTELPFNSNNFSTAHPALSVDEKTLYFASDRPGTLGYSDIFKVKINADGSYGNPENVGNKINTEGKETFPFVSNDNKLYFASDGHPGLGGLDIFVSKIDGNNFKEVKNIGAPVNGKTDDFAFIIDTKSRIGFFSSNREGGEGYDDIYKFKETSILECGQLLAGSITGSETGEVLANSKVSLFDKDMKRIKEIYADKNGAYSFESLECGKTYSVRAEKSEYLTKEQRITLSEKFGKTALSIALEKERTKIKEGIDVAKVLGNIIIYFDLDKSFIHPDAAIELAKIVEVMKANPSIEINVRSHTDCRQTAKYNMGLSEKRAKATMAWLISKGIDKSRITGRGYGESQLLNQCSCEPTNQSDCNEEQHQANRRSEFIVTKL
jgi:outer membrane protein OmpA-like peptidoglycan-associated protein